MSVFKLLISSRWYLWFSLGYLITGIGTGLTGVAIYANLAKLDASPFYFAITFSVSIAPALISSELGKYLSRYFKPFTILIAAELAGLFALILPFYALISANPRVLMLAVAVSSLFVGLGVAAYNMINKRGFTESDYLQIATIETISFSAVTIVGTGIGSLIYPLVQHGWYFFIDAVSYLLAMACLIYSRSISPQQVVDKIEEAAESTLRFTSLNSDKKCALLIMPLLTIIAAPAMALLPVKGLEFTEIKWLGLVINPVLMLLFARCIGQLIGPLVVSQKMVDYLFKSSLGKSCLGLMFFMMYLLAFCATHFFLAFIAVVLAHIASNILYAVAYSTMLSRFSEQEIGPVSVLVYQITTLLLACLALPAGFFANQYGLFNTLLLFSLPAVFLMFLVFNRIAALGKPIAAA
jgi:predicted MFS family arabinose efflux permease